jgi:hypothetical protein
MQKPTAREAMHDSAHRALRPTLTVHNGAALCTKRIRTI